MKAFILTCESTIDLPYSYAQQHDLPILFYSYYVDGVEYLDDMGKESDSLQKFYSYLDAGKLPTTSQVNAVAYMDFFEKQLKRGKDLLHIALGSGMTTSVNNAIQAANMLKEQYPNQRIEIIDSLCSSTGYGFLVDEAVKMLEAGETIDQTITMLMNCRQKIHHQFFSTDLSYYRKSGRMSGAAATIGNVLNIVPIMRLNDQGKIIAYDKVRGVKKAIKETIQTMELHAQDGINYNRKCWICHSNCKEIAEQTKKVVQEHFKNIKGNIPIMDIGTIIASHCGPGTVAVYYFGDQRAPSSSN